MYVCMYVLLFVYLVTLVDLAVDWIEDKIYWTSGADSRIRVLNIAATEQGKRYIDTGFDGTTVFTKIIVDPINRCVVFLICTAYKINMHCIQPAYLHYICEQTVHNHVLVTVFNLHVVRT